MKRINYTLLCLLLISVVYQKSVNAKDEIKWPLWQRFQDNFIDDSGRVIDPYENRNVTTSEGQSYAMFFALVNNQPVLFSRLLAWTESNLAQGDLSTTLPAWQWGENPEGHWGVLDDNSASDSDLWIIYNLIEAARLWNKPEYLVLANKIGQLVMAKEVVEVPGLGITLLPAAKGFYQIDKEVILNPSYLPMQVLTRLASTFENKKWQHLVRTSYRLLVASSPHGFAPDWVKFDFKKGFDFNNAVGSYNAIRVYLWVGMLAQDDEYFKKLAIHFRPILAFVDEHQYAPLSIKLVNVENQGRGGIGFSASLLPLASRSSQPSVKEFLLTEAANCSTTQNVNYYDHVLTLFACGWYEDRFRFLRNGSLQTKVDKL
jgi:endoglucanase